jgi:hypothetical protein
MSELYRRIFDERFGRAWVRCPDDGNVLIPTGYAYAPLVDQGRLHWFVGFECPKHNEEILRIWRPELQLVIDEVLEGIDVDLLPIVDSGLQPL